jgi:hypothetical protein
LRRFELGLSKYEIEEFYPQVLKYHTLQYMTEVGIEFRKARKQEPKPVLPIIDRKKITDWLDSGEDSYEYTAMAKKFGLSNGEAFLLECELLKEGILTKLRPHTSCETICPTYCWQGKKEEKVTKTFEEAFPTPKKEVVPQTTFPKDVVFRDSNVRIINNSGKPLNIEIGSTEIIITIK